MRTFTAMRHRIALLAAIESAMQKLAAPLAFAVMVLLGDPMALAESGERQQDMLVAFLREEQSKNPLIHYQQLPHALCLEFFAKYLKITRHGALLFTFRGRKTHVVHAYCIHEDGSWDEYSSWQACMHYWNNVDSCLDEASPEFNVR